jgi:uncharacterized protein (TIGR02145 family)
VVQPTFSLIAGPYTTAQSVTLSTSTLGASIYYTTDRSVPTTASTLYNGTIAVGATETINAIAVKTGMTNSSLASATYTIAIPGTVAQPTFSLVAGPYTTAQNVALSSTTTGATIYYTTDGSTPSAASALYAGPINVSATETVRAFAVKDGMTSSAVTSAVYTISSVVGPSIPWNNAITYGALSDSRDSKSYRTVTIGSQVWMAENLNYSGSNVRVGVCYHNSVDSCTKYGRLYTWTEVMAGAPSSSSIPSGVQGMCPSGWHVPSDTEWNLLYAYVDARTSVAGMVGTALKSKSGWNSNGTSSGNGTDDYGFRGLPAGDLDNSVYYYIGQDSYWHSTTNTSNGTNYPTGWIMDYTDAGLGSNYGDPGIGYSLRCVRN